MIGLPKQCSTRADYEYIREQNVDGWDYSWRLLLEGRFAIKDDNLIEDSNAKIFLLGFTVAEVSEAIGFSGLTDREIEWQEYQEYQKEMEAA